MTYYELTIDKDKASDLVVDEIFKTFEKTIAGNVDDDAQQHLCIVDTKIAIWKGEWGITRHEEDDLIEISKAHPEHEIRFVRVSDIAAPKSVADLQNYKLQVFEAGVRTGSFDAKPVEWVDDTPSWYV